MNALNGEKCLKNVVVNIFLSFNERNNIKYKILKTHNNLQCKLI